MDRIRGALLAIQADPARATEILRAELAINPDGFIEELAGYLVEVLDGVVPDLKKP